MSQPHTLFHRMSTCFSRRSHPRPPPALSPNAESEASIASRLLFYWIQPLILRGCAAPLQQKDLPPLVFPDRAENLGPIFHHAYRNVAAADSRRDPNSQPQHSQSSSVASHPPSSKSLPTPTSRQSSSHLNFSNPHSPYVQTSPSTQPNSFMLRIAAAIPSKFASRTSRALFPVTGLPFIKAALWKPFWLIGAIGQVFAIRSLVDIVTTTSPENHIANRNLYILAVFAMTFCALLMSLSQHAVFSGSMRAGMRARAAISSEIYRKTLRLDPSSMCFTSEGELGNLLVTDTQRILDSYSYFHFCWFGFIEILVTSALLTIDLQVSALFGIAILILLVPTQISFSVLVSRARTHINKESDVRVQRMNEILCGIRIVKLSTWEPHFINLVSSLRRKEMRHLKLAAILRALNSAVFFAAPVTVALATFTAHTLVFKQPLKPSVVFSSMAFFSVLSRVLTLMPLGWLATSEAKVASHRLDRFFNLPELENLAADQRLDIGTGNGSTSDASVAISDVRSFSSADSGTGEEHISLGCPYVSTNNAQFSYTHSSSSGARTIVPVLNGLNFLCRDGELVSIVGPVGSGKSSLLLGILEELLCTNGSVSRNGSVAYCSQQPWIINGTVRENITLFGATEESFDLEWYNKVVKSCSLEPDLAALPAGDGTEIGERGVNLSGGQKARVALARAVYSKADIYLLDDPLSAVDSAVSARLLRNIFGSKGLLSGKLQIIVTHQLQILPLSTRVMVLGGGTICHSGTFEKLRAQGVEFSGFAGAEDELDMERSEACPETEDSDEESSSQKMQSHKELKALLKDVHVNLTGGDQEAEKSEKFKVGVDEDLDDCSSIEGHHDFGIPAQQQRGQLVAEEDRRVGRVTKQVYKAYIKAGGGYPSLIMVSLSFALAQAVRQGAEVWLGIWSNDDVEKDDPDFISVNRFYVLWYLGLTLGTAALTLFRAALFAERTMTASRRLHDKLLDRILHATMSFFDANPVGRILNRFSKDVDQMDALLPTTAQDCLQIAFVAVGAVATISAILPWFLIPLVPIAAAFIWLQRMYKMSSRELKRIDGVSRSPIYAQYVETSQGLATLRAYKAEESFTDCFNRRIDLNHRAYHMFSCAGRWLGIRLDALTSLVVFCTSLVVLLQSSTLSPGLAGVALTQSILMTGIFQWGVRQAAETENLFTSVERVSHMATETPIEKDYHIPEKEPPKEWPSEGVVSFENVVLRYRPNLDPALQNLSFKTQAHERVGIVGRTGSGKSSMFVSLFRLVELTSGTITVDGRDVSELGLHDLRSRMAIVPQDPVLFNGTIRSNLDPTGQHEDALIWDALHRVHMSDVIQGIGGAVGAEGGGLDLTVHEKGSNFSSGERQLLSLARAILSGVKVVVLDEASASLDNHTDMLIQKTVREQLSNRTVLTIAHRLATVADSDRILVIDAGEAVEFDTPSRLMSRKGYFARLVEETGKLESAILKAIISEAAEKGQKENIALATGSGDENVS